MAWCCGALDPAITGRSAAPTQSIALEVGKDGDAVGKARLVFPLDYGSFIDVVLQGPINKQSAGVPLTDRGLASGASATLGYGLTLWGQTVPASTVAMSTDLSRVAQSARSSQGSASLNALETLIAAGLGMENDVAPRIYTDRSFQVLSDARAAFKARDARSIANTLWETARLSRTLVLRGSYGVGANTFAFAIEGVLEHGELRARRF